VSVEGHLRALFGCEWGHTVATPDDTEPCQGRAERIVVLHDGDEEAAFKLCPRHIERISQEATPRPTYPCAVCGYANTCGEPPGEDCHS